MATGDNTVFESDGKAVSVILQAEVNAGQITLAEGWLGVAVRGGKSGDSAALTIDHSEYQLVVPAGLAVSKGDTIYIDSTDLTGHIPNESAYATSSGANTLALLKATSDKDANNVVTGILLPEGV